MKTIILDDGIEYVIIKELLIDNIKYTLFSNIQDPKDICLRKTIIEKIVDASGDGLLIEFKKEDTAKLEAGKYFWDVKIYNDPIYDEDGILIDAAEINSYYSAFEEPLLIIKEVAKNYE